MTATAGALRAAVDRSTGRRSRSPSRRRGHACFAPAPRSASRFPRASPLSPDHAGGDSSWAWLYLGAMGGGFVLYLAGLLALSRRGARLGAVVALGVAIQLLPLVGPVLLSTDVYTYWARGRVGGDSR